jgi:hypothetical protein
MGFIDASIETVETKIPSFDFLISIASLSMHCTNATQVLPSVRATYTHGNFK